jgi:hypothetical protein
MTPMNRHSMLGVAVVGVMALLIAGTVVPNAEASSYYAGGYFLYSDHNDFWEKLTNEYEEYSGGFSFYINNSEANDIINEYEYFVFNSSENSSERSLYLFGCFLPRAPPLIVGESVQCLVFFYYVVPEASPYPFTPVTTITTNYLHVYVREPVNIPIQDWDWGGPIVNPFFWITDPITLNQAGQWIIVADLIEHEIILADWTENELVISLDVTFQVVPESIIGVAGVVAGPLAVLAYKLRKKSNAQ